MTSAWPETCARMQVSASGGSCAKGCTLGSPADMDQTTLTITNSLQRTANKGGSELATGESHVALLIVMSSDRRYIIMKQGWIDPDYAAYLGDEEDQRHPRDRPNFVLRDDLIDEVGHGAVFLLLCAAAMQAWYRGLGRLPALGLSGQAGFCLAPDAAATEALAVLEWCCTLWLDSRHATEVRDYLAAWGEHRGFWQNRRDGMLPAVPIRWRHIQCPDRAPFDCLRTPAWTEWVQRGARRHWERIQPRQEDSTTDSPEGDSGSDSA
jgi:hypothetical protein